MTLTDRIIAVHTRFPHWSAGQIAAPLGTSSAYVCVVARRH
jgi:hypothetical protein